MRQNTVFSTNNTEDLQKLQLYCTLLLLRTDFL